MPAMQAASLEVLEKANVPPGQARAIVQAIDIESLGEEMHSIARENLRTMTAVTIGSMTSVLAVVLNVIYFLFHHGTQ